MGTPDAIRAPPPYVGPVPALLWFRRDLRLADNPALLAAAQEGAVLPLFVVDPTLWDRAEGPRQHYLAASLADLSERIGGLHIRYGRPEKVIPEVVRETGARSVHIAADYSPYGRERDARVARALTDANAELIATGSPYAVAPGRVRKSDDTPYRVYTPFYRAWRAHGWRAPADDATNVEWLTVPGEGMPVPSTPLPYELPPAGEQAAWNRWEYFRDHHLADYAEARDRPAVDGTSALSHHLKYGEIHPRSLLAELGESAAHDVYRKELAWREFYADVLFHNPASAHVSLDARYEDMRWIDQGDPDFNAYLEAWKSGMTGYPFVDAGMRQLLHEGWMHNRVRMVVASFLIKDLHIRWQHGADHFMRNLRDGDIASNAHGWQWTAGCGTDASPFYRVFNPVSQGLKFDPSGDYVRTYIPELAHLPGKTAHEPWDTLGGLDHGYPERIVDHSVERQVALADHAAATKKG